MNINLKRGAASSSKRLEERVVKIGKTKAKIPLLSIHDGKNEQSTANGGKKSLERVTFLWREGGQNDAELRRSWRLVLS